MLVPMRSPSGVTPRSEAGALPAAISYNAGDRIWLAGHIAEFQAARLAECGYRLVYEEPES